MSLVIHMWLTPSEKIVDKVETFAALLTDLTKAFDILSHHLLIPKLHSYPFGYLH